VVKKFGRKRKRKREGKKSNIAEQKETKINNSLTAEEVRGGEEETPWGGEGKERVNSKSNVEGYT